MRLCTILCVVVLLIALAMGVSACKKETPPELEVHFEGVAYRGAELTLTAEISAALSAELEENGRSVAFDIIEGSDACYLYNGKLKILNSAPYGAHIAVRVSALDYEQTVECTVGHTPVSALTIDSVPTLAAGSAYDLTATLEPFYADDNEVTYVLTQGADVAYVLKGMLYIADTADASDTISVVATSGGVASAPVTVQVGTVQVRDLQVNLLDTDTLQSVDTILQREDSVTIEVATVPENATLPVRIRKVDSDYTDQYVGLEKNVLTIATDAPEGTFDVVVSAGQIAKTVAFTVAKTPVTRVGLTRTVEGYTVAYGTIIGTTCRVYPLYATYSDVTYTVEEGAEYVEAQSTPGYYRVTTREAGKIIVIRATADGKYDELRLTTVGVKVQKVKVSVEADGTSVRVGDTRTLQITVTPAECENYVQYEVVTGKDLCTLEGNVITFVKLDKESDEVMVRASAGDVSDVIIFYLVRVPVSSVVISTDDPTMGLVAGDTVTFTGRVEPAEASCPDVTYRIVSGGAYGTLDGNVFTVGYNTIAGTVIVEAVAGDGVTSNRIELTVKAANTYSPTFTSWSDLDANPRLFDGQSDVYLDLRSLPYDAGDCVVVVSSSVDALTLRGNYQGTTDTCYKNLYFYFLNTGSISVYLNGMGIVIDNGFTDTVLDFGSATVTLTVENNNYIAAGHAYALSTVGFMIADDSDNRLMDGMDGFAGQDGGTALSAYAITVAGAGNLTLVGGDASSGTDATDGLSTTLDATYAGNGGWGGNGGEGGYAIYAHSLTYDLTGHLVLMAGASGTAGEGGRGRTAPLTA